MIIFAVMPSYIYIYIWARPYTHIIICVVIIVKTISCACTVLQWFCCSPLLTCSSYIYYIHMFLLQSGSCMSVVVLVLVPLVVVVVVVVLERKKHSKAANCPTTRKTSRPGQSELNPKSPNISSKGLSTPEKKIFWKEYPVEKPWKTSFMGLIENYGFVEGSFSGKALCFLIAFSLNKQKHSFKKKKHIWFQKMVNQPKIWLFKNKNGWCSTGALGSPCRALSGNALQSSCNWNVSSSGLGANISSVTRPWRRNSRKNTKQKGLCFVFLAFSLGFLFFSRVFSGLGFSKVSNFGFWSELLYLSASFGRKKAYFKRDDFSICLRGLLKQI